MKTLFKILKGSFFFRKKNTPLFFKKHQAIIPSIYESSCWHKHYLGVERMDRILYIAYTTGEQHPLISRMRAQSVSLVSQRV